MHYLHLTVTATACSGRASPPTSSLRLARCRGRHVALTSSIQNDSATRISCKPIHYFSSLTSSGHAPKCVPAGWPSQQAAKATAPASMGRVPGSLRTAFEAPNRSRQDSYRHKTETKSSRVRIREVPHAAFVTASPRLKMHAVEASFKRPAWCCVRLATVLRGSRARHADSQTMRQSRSTKLARRCRENGRSWLILSACQHDVDQNVPNRDSQ